MTSNDSKPPEDGQSSETDREFPREPETGNAADPSFPETGQGKPGETFRDGPSADEEVPSTAAEATDEAEAAAAEASDAEEAGDANRHEAAKWKEVAMRTAADLENYRKRASREREESMRYANQSLLEDLLPILDNFEMGMQAAAQEKDSMVYVGMNMVRQQFADFMAAQGVTEIACQGQPFDPNRHEAVSEETSDEIPPGHVIRVTRRGFMLRDRLLRPASVVVAREPQDGGESDASENEPQA